MWNKQRLRHAKYEKLRLLVFMFLAWLAAITVPHSVVLFTPDLSRKPTILTQRRSSDFLSLFSFIISYVSLPHGYIL
uniref:Uncharacterized protein n=1 Tax=Glossina palpalis gambiensis TaxID=67801 RepID=A0A1B0BY11_9MUSC